jgi:adenosylmethionine-8-amino-7-oxononanoate aminotransferase
MLAGFTHEPVIELSEQLAALTGHALGHAFYAPTAPRRSRSR